jgi:antitoxin HigA-1
MNQELALLKGIHPGIILARKLKERNLSKGAFALSIQEYPQTLGTITKGKRHMNTPLALKIEEALNLPEGYFMTLQIFYEIKETKRKRNEHSHPDLSRLRPGLFWDTDLNKMDWHRQRTAVIQRVFERGNDQEKEEIQRFYGADEVMKIQGKNDPDA